MKFTARLAGCYRVTRACAGFLYGFAQGFVRGLRIAWRHAQSRTDA